MPAIASADPAAVSSAKREAQALREQVQELDDTLEAAREDYSYAKLQLDETQKAIETNQAHLAQAETDLGIANDRLEQRVVNIYRNGRVGLLDALFGADSFGDFINRFDLLTLIGVQDGVVLGQVSTYREDVARRKEQLASDQQKQKELLAQAKDATARVEQKLAERKKLLAGKEKEIAQLEREEEQRQRKLAEEAAKAAEAARKAAQRARQQTTSTKKGSSGGSSAGASQPSHNVPSSSVGGSVVDVALRYVGVPYVWGGESPSGFDCSGLVKYSFAQVGVSLPHSSRALYGVGEAVARSDLQPGDLVFFGSPIHHVGIYVGGGNMVHAPYTGANVRVNSIDRSNYTGARRIL
ncbi:MAG: C40 family peptidase [Thermoleophilia bacterium]